MPGENQHGLKHYITPQFLYREAITEDDTEAPDVHLPLEGNQHAVENWIWLIPVNTGTASTVTLKVFAQFSGSVTSNVLLATYNDVASLSLITIPNVPAYPIKIVVADVEEGAIWEIHAAHTGNINTFAG